MPTTKLEFHVEGALLAMDLSKTIKAVARGELTRDPRDSYNPAPFHNQKSAASPLLKQISQQACLYHMREKRP